MYEMCGHLSSNMWSLEWKSWLYSTNPDACLAHERDRLVMSNRSCIVCLEKNGNGLLARKNVGKKMCCGRTKDE